MNVTVETLVRIEMTRSEAKEFYGQHRPKEGTIGSRLDVALVGAFEVLDRMEAAR